MGALDDGRALVHAAAEPVRLVPGVVAVAAVALGLGVGGVARQVLAGRVADALGLKLVDRPVVRALVHIHDLWPSIPQYTVDPKHANATPAMAKQRV